MEDERVTVVVMSRDRCTELLTSVPRHDARVVLVDNDSTDGSPAQVRSRFPHVTVVELDENVGSLARNVGVELARTPYVAFADDDSWWSPGALHTCAQVLAEHPRVAGVAVAVRVGPDERADPMNAELARSPLRSPGLPGPRVLGFVACATMVRRDAFLAVGGFDPLVRFPGEEEPVALRLAARGWSVVYVDDVVVHHHPSPARSSPQERAAAIARSSMTSALLLRPWPDVLRRAGALAVGGRAQRRGLARSLTSAHLALRRRRPVPEAVRKDLAAVARASRVR